MDSRVQEEIERALSGDPEAVRALVELLTPVIQDRVEAALGRRRGQALGRNVSQEIEDMTQEVFVSLFESGGKALRAWSPHRGVPFERFIGFLAERQVATILRSGKRSPWREDPTLDADLDVPAPHAPRDGLELQITSRDLLEHLLDRVRMELSPLGLKLFYALLVEERSVVELGREMNMSADALYAWKSRLGKLVRKLGAELRAEEAPLQLRRAGGKRHE